MREIVYSASSFTLTQEGKFAYLDGITPRGPERIALYNALCTECGSSRLVPGDARWGRWIEDVFPGRFRTVTRFHLEGDSTTYDEERLRRAVAAFPEGFCLKPFDEEIMAKAAAEEWSSDFVNGLSDPERAVAEGTCYASLEDGIIVSGCTGCILSPELMEVEIITRKGYRKRGMATASAASVILACMEKGIRPEWDASSRFTVMLAEKQGFRCTREYQVYEISVEDL
ncbi:MAG: GNAT family N-acetyltransferase [Stomatobaculum sp.]|nr:GNAT family N-acetyltransferase [Stomatobaculum sp.]